MTQDTHARVCEVCGETYNATYANQRTCGAANGYECTSMIKPRSRLQGYEAANECAWCGKTMRYFHKAGSRLFCSSRCRNWLNNWNQLTGFGRKIHASQLSWSECRQCGRAFTHRASRSPLFCSERCSRNAAMRRRSHQIRSGLRTSDQFTLRDVAKRDGWRCHICHRKVRDVPYSGKPSDATIDHLIPLSADGVHMLSNVALAHMGCNSRRSDRGAAQLLLVG